MQDAQSKNPVQDKHSKPIMYVKVFLIGQIDNKAGKKGHNSTNLNSLLAFFSFHRYINHKTRAFPKLALH